MVNRSKYELSDTNNDCFIWFVWGYLSSILSSLYEALLAAAQITVFMTLAEMEIQLTDIGITCFQIRNST